MKSVTLALFTLIGIFSNLIADDMQNTKNIKKLKDDGLLEIIKTSESGNQSPSIPVVCVASCYHHEDKKPNDK